MTVHSHWLFKASQIINDGGVVALPYERLFGLAANALNPEAVARVAAIKSRTLGAPDRRPISVVISSLDQVQKVTSSFSPLAQRLAERHWPGLLTMICEAKEGLAAELVSDVGLIGVRYPGDCPALELARASGCVLTATSANRAGAVDALSDDDVHGLEGIDLIVPGTVAGPPGSTVVDVTGEHLRIVRLGAVALDNVDDSGED